MGGRFQSVVGACEWTAWAYPGRSAALVKTAPVKNNYVTEDMQKNMNEHLDAVVKMWNEGGFHAEMVWLMILTAKGFYAHFYHFCAVMRWRAGIKEENNELFIREAMPHMC